VPREAASAEIELQSLEEAQAACLRVGQLGERPDIYNPLAQRLEQVTRSCMATSNLVGNNSWVYRMKDAN